MLPMTQEEAYACHALAEGRPRWSLFAFIFLEGLVSADSLGSQEVGWLGWFRGRRGGAGRLWLRE